jgi:hypothetical protein
VTERTDSTEASVPRAHPLVSTRVPSSRWRLAAGAAVLAAAALLTSACVVAPAPAYGGATYSAPAPLPRAWVPPGYVSIRFGGAYYLYGDGYFHRWHDHRLVVVAPPYGVVVPALPHGYREVRHGGRYYTYRGIYYQRGHKGWRVVRPPRRHR